ncbi:dienelactone hydrolase family protein [Brucellaceae bacterium C25G]
MTAPSDALLPFLDKRIRTLPYPLAFQSPFLPWQEKAREKFFSAIPHVGVAKTNLLAEKANQYLYNFQYTTGSSGEGVLLLPEGNGSHPAVLLMHDHGGEFSIGWRKMVANPEGVEHAERHYDGRFLADWLRQQGYAVLVTDALGWGSRFAGGYSEQQALASQVMQAGMSLAGIVATEDAEAFRWLSQQPQINPATIAVFGYSFGGFRAWQLAALEQNVAVTISLGWMGEKAGLLTPKSTLLRGQSAFYTLHPALAKLIDYPDMAGIAADRPMFMRIGNQDRHFPAFTVEAALKRIEHIAHAADGDFDGSLFSGGHHCPKMIQDLAASFLFRHLGR